MVTRNYLSYKKNNLIIFLFIIYLLFVFKSYNGNINDGYSKFWIYLDDPGLFQNDFFLRNSNQTNINLIYYFFNIIGINLNNDYIGFIVHLVFTSLSGFFLFLILKKIITKENFFLLITFLFIIHSASGFFLGDNLSSWIINRTASAAYFSQTFQFIFIWLLLTRKNFIIFLVGSLLVFINIRSSFFFLLSGSLYSLIISLNKDDKNFFSLIKDNYWILGPFLSVLFIKFNNPEFHSNPSIKAYIIENILSRDNFRVAFHYYSNIKIFFFAFSFIIYFLLLKQIKNIQYFIFFFIVWLLSLVIFFISYIYLKYFYNLYPIIPEIIALSPIRAMSLYILFFWILVLLYISKLNLSLFRKLLILLLIFFFSIGLESHRALYFIPLILLLFIYKRKVSTKKSFYICYAFIFVTIAWLSYKHFKSTFNFYSLQKINKWNVRDLNKNNDRLNSLILLSKCEDFVLIDLNSDNQMSNLIAKKSSFVGDVASNYFDIKYIKKVNERKAIYDSLKTDVQKNNIIKNEDKAYLFDLQTIILITADKKIFFSEDIITIRINEKDILAIFMSKKTFNKKCKPYLKILSLKKTMKLIKLND